MQFETILYEKQGQVAVLTINREKAMNSINSQTSYEMQQAWADFRDDRELRVAIRKGEHIALEEVRGEWTLRVARATNLLRNKFENELPPILSGLDATGIQAECRRAIDEELAALHQGA